MPLRAGLWTHSDNQMPSMCLEPSVPPQCQDKTQTNGWRCGSMVEHLPRMQKGLGSTPSNRVCWLWVEL